MTSQEILKEIETRFGYGTTFDMSLREKDGHWLIARVKKLTEALEYYNKIDALLDTKGNFMYSVARKALEEE